VPNRKQQELVPTTPAVPLTRAAAYVRMSRDSQEYSPINQMTLIGKYASDHDMQIVKTYSDEGISGLRIALA
jgi:DNA invertase Pin-like site-specific DNA recombinase